MEFCDELLNDRIKGRVCHGTSPGPSTVLSYDEEASLVSYVLYMADREFLSLDAWLLHLLGPSR